jgi:hypothetical protein
MLARRLDHKNERIENLENHLRDYQTKYSTERSEHLKTIKRLERYKSYGTTDDITRDDITSSASSSDIIYGSRGPIDPYGKEFTYYKYEYYRLKEENALLSKMLLEKVEEWEEKDKDTIIENAKI